MERCLVLCLSVFLGAVKRCMSGGSLRGAQTAKPAWRSGAGHRLQNAGLGSRHPLARLPANLPTRQRAGSVNSSGCQPPVSV
jgi:hypothetical protein